MKKILQKVLDYIEVSEERCPISNQRLLPNGEMFRGLCTVADSLYFDRSIDISKNLIKADLERYDTYLRKNLTKGRTFVWPFEDDESRINWLKQEIEKL